MISIREYQIFRQEEILRLYESVGWTSYLERRDVLKRAYENSLYVLGAYDEDRLVGILRAVGDGSSIVFIQDILILPEYQRQGIGTALLKTAMGKYKDVYQLELLTDNSEKTIAFYRSVGMLPATDIGCLSFIRM